MFILLPHLVPCNATQNNRLCCPFNLYITLIIVIIKCKIFVIKNNIYIYCAY